MTARLDDLARAVVATLALVALSIALSAAYHRVIHGGSGGMRTIRIPGRWTVEDVRHGGSTWATWTYEPARVEERWACERCEGDERLRGAKVASQ